MKKKYKLVFMSLLAFGIIGLRRPVAASELNFGVTPIIPDFQVDKEKTYFDIKVNKGEEQELEVTLKNHTKKPVVVQASFHRATTNINGIVEYGEGKFKKDSSLNYDIEKIVTIDQPEIKVEPNQDEMIKLHIKQPREDFPGVLAGGITFKEKSVDKEDKADQGMSIQNEYAYTIAVVIHGNVEQREIPSKLLLNKVEAGQVNARNAILANLQNPQSKYLNKLAVEAKIYKKGSDKVIYSGAQDKMQMAPNSNFDYPVQLNGKRLEAGEYTLKLHGASKKDKWDLEKDFTITKEEAKEYNEEDVTIKEDHTSRNIWGGIIIVIILQLVIVFLIRKNRKKQPKKKNGSSKKAPKNRPKPNKSKPVNNRNKPNTNKNKRERDRRK